MPWAQNGKGCPKLPELLDCVAVFHKIITPAYSLYCSEPVAIYYSECLPKNYSYATASALFGEVVNNQTRKGLLLSLSVIFKSVNIWQSYKQERDCLLHFLRLFSSVLARRAKCMRQPRSCL